MLMDYGISSSTPWIVDGVSVKEENKNAWLGAQTPTEDQLLVLEFTPDHPDYNTVCNLKAGEKMHLLPSGVPNSLDYDSGAYRLQIGWPKGYKEPEGLSALREEVNDEVSRHSEWCSSDCKTFVAGLYRGKRIVEKMSKEKVQGNFNLCHLPRL